MLLLEEIADICFPHLYVHGVLMQICFAFSNSDIGLLG